MASDSAARPPPDAVVGATPEADASIERRFEALVGELLALDAVTPPGQTQGFGSHALRVRGKIFAMLVRGRLVVKLPKPRVDALLAAGEGVRFDANKGTAMREWFALDPASTLDWVALGREAYAFVAGGSAARR